MSAIPTQSQLDASPISGIVVRRGIEIRIALARQLSSACSPAVRQDPDT
jgi:hypothetical protein